MSVIKGTRASEALTALYEKFGNDDRLQLQDDFKAILTTPAGRRVLVAILWKENVFGTIGESGENTTQVMIEVGRHNLAQEILAMANQANYEAVALAIKERNAILSDRNKQVKLIKDRLEK